MEATKWTVTLLGSTLLGLALLGSTPTTTLAVGAPRILAADDADKPDGPRPPLVFTPFVCAGRTTLSLTPALWDTVITDDTTGGPVQLPGYVCRGWPEQGPEHVYRLEVAADLQLWAGLSGLGTQDLDLFLLDGCDTDQCLAGANTELRAVLPAGTYWLVVDGYGTGVPAAGPYTLSLETRWPGVPPQICLEGGATSVPCAGTLIGLTGTVDGAPDLLRTFDCGPSPIVGGEAWYAITLPGTHEVAVSATPDAFAAALDLVLWLFDGCGAAAGCLDYADEKAGGQVETLTYVNTSADPVTVYLAVDSLRVPSAGQGGFAIDFACQSNVATEHRSLGAIRSLFR